MSLSDRENILAKNDSIFAGPEAEKGSPTTFQRGV